MPTWWRYNPATHIFEQSLNEGTSWAPPPLHASIITEGVFAPARLPPYPVVPGNIAFTNIDNNFSSIQTLPNERIRGTYSILYFDTTNAQLNRKRSRILFYDLGGFTWEVFDDADVYVGQPFTFSREGDLIISRNLGISGGSITFPAAQVANATANVLDDYEEGSWTPTLWSAGGGYATLSVAIGKYVKIGRNVQFDGRLTVSNKAGMAAGQVYIAGFPFVSSSENYYPFSIDYWFVLAGAHATWIEAMVYPAGTAAFMHFTPGAAANVSSLTVTNIANGTDFIFRGHYNTPS